jgi:hypothetical protein
VLELSYTAFDLSLFAKDCNYHGPPFKWDEERRLLLRSELDVAYFHLYGIERDDVDYIMETFPIVKRKDEEKYGEYRTKRVILEIYDEIAEAMRTGKPYQTRLDPSPGPPCDEDGNFIPMSRWDRANWPSHIHLPKEEMVEIPEIDESVLAAVSYPITETDKAICAAALAIVERANGLSSMDHLDALLFVTHPEWCRAFLPQTELTDFNAAVTNAPNALFIEPNQSIRWKDCRDYLEKHRAISVNRTMTEQPIKVETDLKKVKGKLPKGVDNVVVYALKALERVNELRKDLKSQTREQQNILRNFNQQHRQYALIA